MSEQPARDHLLDQLPVEEDDLTAVEIHHRQGETVYGTLAYRTTLDQVSDRDTQLPVIQIESFVIDYDRPHVSILDDNSLWIPADEDSVSNLMQIIARSRSEIGESIPDDSPPAMIGSEDVDTELALSREIDLSGGDMGQHTDRMDRETGIDPSREWGYGAGPPPEIEHVADRLREAGLDPAEHTTRLRWGQKEPMTRTPRPVDELVGNYGIELLPREEGLVAIDIDHPEHFPEEIEIPDTFEVSSPHGGDERRHVVLRCDSKDEIREYLNGSWAVQELDWGDLWVGDRYLVGPGSQLGEYGCDKGDTERGDEGGCVHCEDPEDGYYEIVSDHEIETVSPDYIIDLLEATDSYSTLSGREHQTAPPEEIDQDNPTRPQEEHVEEAMTTCDSCGDIIETDDAVCLEADGKVRYVCPGGCDD